MPTNRADNNPIGDTPAPGGTPAPGDTPAPVVRAAPERASAPGELAGGDAGAGAFLTDEVFLYRVVRSVPGDVGELVELEDCFGLDIVQARVTDLSERGFRVVAPAPVEPPGKPHSA